MSDRTLKLAGGLVAIVNGALILVGASLLATLLGDPIPVDETWGFRGSGTVYALSIASVGWVIANRHPRHAVGWTLSGAGLCASLLAFGEGYGLYNVVNTGSDLPGSVVVSWMTSGIWIPMLGFLALMMLVFPTGRLPSPRWRPVVWMLPFTILLALLTESFSTGVLDSGVVKVDNPYGRFGVPEWLREMAPLPLVICVLLAAMAIGLRVRRAGGEERAQLKWLMASGFFMGTTFVAFGLSTVAAPFLIDELEAVNAVSVVSIPLATGIAIVKYRLYDIDLIINRTLVYGGLTAILAALYFVLVVAFQRALAPVTEQSDVAVAASTLAVAALFRPLRGWVQSFIDRRFYRSHYDAAKTLESFSARLRNEIDLDNLSSELLGVVSDTMRPRHASIWLKTGAGP